MNDDGHAFDPFPVGITDPVPASIVELTDREMGSLRSIKMATGAELEARRTLTAPEDVTRRFTGEREEILQSRTEQGYAFIDRSTSDSWSLGNREPDPDLGHRMRELL